MKILVAPSAMKGSINAVDFAFAVEEGLFNAGAKNIVKIPVADGGDDTALVLSKALNATFIPCNVHDPLMRNIDSGFYITNENKAIIDMASASGLKLLKSSEYSAMNTTSYGTGELIKQAIHKGAKSILLGLGGSATVDAGMGALIALGFRFYSGGNLIEKGSGTEMGNVTFIDSSNVDRAVLEIPITILSDVTNTILGENGAAPVYAPQKGATSSEVKQLNKNLSLFTGAIYQTSGNDVSKLEGGGAAGGIAATLVVLLNAHIENGAKYILEKVKFFEYAAQSDCIITGEGQIDETSFAGKATGHIFDFGMKIDKPVYVICGTSSLSKEKSMHNIYTLITADCDAKCAMNNTYSLVVELARKLGEKILYGE